MCAKVPQVPGGKHAEVKPAGKSGVEKQIRCTLPRIGGGGGWRGAWCSEEGVTGRQSGSALDPARTEGAAAGGTGVSLLT